MKIELFGLVAALSAANLLAGADEVMLVEDGAAKCRVVVAADAHPALKFGARELATYFAKATGCGALDGAYPVEIAVDEGAGMKEDGFTLDVTPERLRIVGANPRGALYGCYEILKKYAGMRWIIPGDDGEYCVLRGKSVVVPVGKRTANPYMRVRKTCSDAENGWLWHARNNMYCNTHRARYEDAKGNPTAQVVRLEELCVKGLGTAGNSHIMMDMMCAWAGKKTHEKIDELFEAHPEYFPLIAGKRTPIYDAGDPNPCVSNPDLLDLMAKNLYDHVKGPHGSQDYVTIGNNDTTIWCECEKCKAIDAPELRGTKGARADRYWYMVNEIAKRIWAVDPSVRLGGWAYQDFWYPPAKAKLDPRLQARISFNNQCWRHAVDDPKCTVNAEWRKIFEAWAKTGHPLVANRDEIGCGGTPGSSYAPVEGILRANFLAYPKYGCAGSDFQIYAPGELARHFAKKPPYYGKASRWHSMWQGCYMGAKMMWNPSEVDFDADLEEANRLYYGEAAWNGGMRDFRALLTKAWVETPGCYGWGLGSPLGRCLDQAGMEDRLVALLDKAVKAAEASGDARAVGHVRLDRYMFEKTWVAERKNYLANFKELTAYRKTGEITIDGVLDEADWANADALATFKIGGMAACTTPDLRIEPTSARVVYDPEALYIAVECMEPTPGKMVAAKKLPEDPGAQYRAIGNHVELFYNYPDMFDKFYHLMINSNGEIIPAIQDGTQRTRITTQAKYAVKVLKDRWIVEIAIPTSEIGMKCFDGATWKMNVGRCRWVEGGPKHGEASSCCNGNFGAPSSFVNVKFAPARAKGLHQGAQVSAWANGGFEKTIANKDVNRHYRWNKLTFPEGDDTVPATWFGGNLCGEFRAEDGNRYMRLRHGPGSYMSQYYISNNPGKVRVSFRIRGTGKVSLWTCLYTDTPTHYGYAIQDGTSKSETFAATPEWQTFTTDRVKNGKPTERMAVRFTPQEGAEIDIDDVIVSPVE